MRLQIVRGGNTRNYLTLGGNNREKLSKCLIVRFYNMFSFCCSILLTTKCKIRLETSERKNSCLESTVEAFHQGNLPGLPFISQRWETKKNLRNFPQIHRQPVWLFISFLKKSCLPPTLPSQCRRSSKGLRSTPLREGPNLVAHGTWSTPGFSRWEHTCQPLAGGLLEPLTHSRPIHLHSLWIGWIC